ncbi:hypothetical protein WT54_00710 [Burkholderia territorii]|nr:hypothetical protein WT54_00710 [Burkholderia territorii]
MTRASAAEHARACMQRSDAKRYGNESRNEPTEANGYACKREAPPTSTNARAQFVVTGATRLLPAE